MKQNNLNTFRILFLIKGIFAILGSLGALLYAFFGMFMFTEIAKHEENMPFNPGVIFLVIGVFGFLILLTMGILNLMASKRLNEIRGYQFINLEKAHGKNKGSSDKSTIHTFILSSLEADGN